MSRTLNQVRQMVAVAGGEPFSLTEVDAAINEGVAAIRNNLFVPLAPVTAALVAGTYEYSLGASIAVILVVSIDSEPIPAYGWSLVEGTTPKIRLNKALYPTLSGTISVEGLGMQAYVSNGSDAVTVDADYIVAHALSVLHAARIEQAVAQPESERLVAVHEQAQGKFSALAQAALARALAGQMLPPTARRVRSNLAT